MTDHPKDHLAHNCRSVLRLGAQNVARTPLAAESWPAQNGTYALVALDAQIAGYVL
jgi:hypothetical protein